MSLLLWLEQWVGQRDEARRTRATCWNNDEAVRGDFFGFNEFNNFLYGSLSISLWLCFAAFFPPLPIVCQLTKPKNTTKREKFMDLCDGDSAVGVGGGDKNLGKSDIILGLIVTKGLFEEFINKWFSFLLSLLALWGFDSRRMELCGGENGCITPCAWPLDLVGLRNGSFACLVDQMSLKN